MCVNYKIDHIHKNPKRRPGTKITPKYLTIHSTGNANSTAQNERNWLENPSNTRTASWHICVDENIAIEAIPLNEVAFHAGTRDGNYSSISIEICESGDREKTLAHAVEVAAYILKQHGWGTDKLRRHYDWSGKICPRIFYDNGKWTGWERFKQMIQKELAGGEKKMSNQPSSWAKEAWEWAKKKGLLDGTRPKEAITREELAVILKRLVEEK